MSSEDRLALAVWNVERSLRLDLGILARTVRTVLRRAGIGAFGHVTMTELRPELATRRDGR